jgi:hypothetical protein
MVNLTKCNENFLTLFLSHWLAGLGWTWEDIRPMCDVSTPMQSQPKYIRLTRLGRAAWSDLSALLCARTEIDSLCLVRSSGGDGLEMCREDRASIWCKLVCPRARALHDLLVTVENCGAENRRCGFTLFIASRTRPLGHLYRRDANGHSAIVFFRRDRKCVWDLLQRGDAK